MHGPLQAFRAQRIGATQHVQQIPAAAFVLPLARIRVEQVAPKQEARHFVVETDRVVAHAYRARTRQLLFDHVGKLNFGQALIQAGLRQDAREQTGFGLGQKVRRRLAIVAQGRIDLVQCHVSAHARELRRPVTPRVDAEGFVVVPEKTELGAWIQGASIRGSADDAPAAARQRIIPCAKLSLSRIRGTCTSGDSSQFGPSIRRPHGRRPDQTCAPSP